VADEAGTIVTLNGQDKDAATSGLARMNMILHNNPTALIVQGNSLTDPKFKDGDTLKTCDYVVANPHGRLASCRMSVRRLLVMNLR
jgi:type I restriction enzyme M protein